jgi:hypothetical protein
MGSFTFQTIGNGTGTATTALTILAPAGIVNGDLLIAFLYTEGVGATGASCPGWIRRVGPTGATDHTIQVFYKYALGESGNYVFSDASATFMQGNILRYSGGQTFGDPFGIIGPVTTAAASTTLVLPSVNVAYANELLVGYCNYFNASNFGSISAGTSRVGTGYQDSFIFDEVRAAGATGTRTLTLNTADNIGGVLFTLKSIYTVNPVKWVQTIAPVTGASPLTSGSFTPSAGNTLLLACVDGSSGGATFTFTGFTKLSPPGDFSDVNGNTEALGYRIAVGGSQTFTISSTVTHTLWGFAWEYSGVATPTSVTMVSSGANNPQGTTTPSGTAVVVPLGSILLALCFDVGAGGAITATGGATTRGSGLLGQQYCAGEWAGRGGAITPTFSVGGSGNYVILQFLLPSSSDYKGKLSSNGQLYSVNFVENGAAVQAGNAAVKMYLGGPTQILNIVEFTPASGAVTPAIAQQRPYNANTATANTIQDTITVTKGNHIVAHVACDRAGGAITIVGVSDGQGSYAVGDPKRDDTVNNQFGAVYYLENANGGTHVVTFQVAGGAPGNMIIRLFEVSGLLIPSLDKDTGQTQAAPGTGTDLVFSGSTATTAASEVFIMGFSQNTGEGIPGTSVLSAGTGFTKIGTDSYMGAEYQWVHSPVAANATFTHSFSVSRVNHVLAFKAANSAAVAAQPTKLFSNGTFATNSYSEVTPIPKVNTYYTTFSTTEYPLRESGRWLEGASDAIKFGDVKVTGASPKGNAYADHMISLAGDYSDSLAVMNPAMVDCTNDHWAIATLYYDAAYIPPSSHECEILLRGSVNPLGPKYFPLIEVNIPAGTSAGQTGTTGQIIDQDGTVGGFTFPVITGPGWGGAGWTMQTGDQVLATVQGQTVNVYSKVAAHGVTTWTLSMSCTSNTVGPGQPGVGFFVRTGAGADPTKFCFSDFRCGVGTSYPA